jgi:hypothetical protein
VLDDQAERADLDLAAGQLQAKSIDDRHCGLAGCAVADGDVRRPMRPVGILMAVPAGLRSGYSRRVVNGEKGLARGYGEHDGFGVIADAAERCGDRAVSASSCRLSGSSAGAGLGRSRRVTKTVYEFGQLVKGTPKFEAARGRSSFPS